MRKRIFVVESGAVARPPCLISLPLEIQATDPITAVEVRVNGKPAPSELLHHPDGATIQVLLLCDRMAVGEERLVDVILPDSAEAVREASTNAVEVENHGDHVDFTIGGELFTTYHYHTGLARPCFHPLNAAGGLSVVRGWPMQDAIEGESKDHPHHRGLWVAHGEVNGVDNWSEAPNHAWTRHTHFGSLRSGPVRGHMDARSTWTAPDGTELLEETRQVNIFALPDGSRILEVDTHLLAHAGAVTFGDTKEGGLCSIRVASTMDASSGGRIENAAGRVGEKQAWGKRSDWCDYSGPVSGQTVGVAIMDHPENFRHPTYWHVRDYGLMTANPFGVAAFTGDSSESGAHTLAEGESLLFRYRVLVHRGVPSEADVAGHYRNWIDPPRVTPKA